MGKLVATTVSSPRATDSRSLGSKLQIKSGMGAQGGANHLETPIFKALNERSRIHQSYEGSGGRVRRQRTNVGCCKSAEHERNVGVSSGSRSSWKQCLRRSVVFPYNCSIGHRSLHVMVFSSNCTTSILTKNASQNARTRTTYLSVTRSDRSSKLFGRVCKKMPCHQVRHNQHQRMLMIGL